MLTMHVHADCYLHVAHLFVVNFTFKLALDRESQVMHANQQHARALMHAVVRLHIFMQYKDAGNPYSGEQCPKSRLIFSFLSDIETMISNGK